MIFKKCSVHNTIIGEPQSGDDTTCEDMVESGK